MQKYKTKRSGEQGQGLIEYTFLLILVAMVVLLVLIIFGPQFSKAYAASAGEDYKTSGDAAAKVRLTITPNQVKR